MFILNPDQYLLPDYKISPFSTKDIALNAKLPDDNTIDTYFKERFRNRNFSYTLNARSALFKALSHYQLNETDVVTILTTSQNYYVSSCVTGVVEKFCNWNRQVTALTKVIVVVHEFGYPYQHMHELARLNIPIIEDCAYAFFSEDKEKTIGTIGDFCIYSFPKMFAIQVGGLLTSKVPVKLITEDWPQSGMEVYIKKVLSYYIKGSKQIIRQRIDNYQWLKEQLQDLGFRERFALQQGTVPGVYMFTVDSDKINLPELKKYLFKHGTQCSVFYGEQAFFVPNHQQLRQEDLQYFFMVIKSYKDNSDS